MPKSVEADDPESAPPLTVTAVPEDLRAPFLSALIREFPLGVVLFDADGHFLFVNEATAAMNGVPAAAHIGRHIRDVVPDLWDDAEPILQRALAGEIVQWEVSGETPAAPGVLRHWSEQWFPLRNTHGEVVAVAGTILETTEQKRAEASQRRTAEMRERLIHVASHELRTPLTSVLGFAHRLARREELDEQTRDEIGIILDQATAMRHRLERFLTLSELEEFGGADELSLEAVDLSELVADEFRPLALHHPGVRFERECDGDAVIHADRHLLRQIISNLLENAAKYGGAAGVVTVRIERGPSEIVIAVHDDGLGIPQELQPRLFEPGFRTPDAARSGIEGQGLGLYVASQLASRSGGSLSVRSEPGRGTTFALSLPLEPPVS